jgi:phage tail-like protein
MRRPTWAPPPGHKYVDTLTLRGPLTSGRKGASGQSEILQNGSGSFAIEIEGAPVASANVESITMEDLVIDEREMTTGADWDYRVYGPGDAHYGSITIRSLAADDTELYDWWAEAAQGKNIRKSISVIALKRDGSEARRYNYHDCFPVRYMPHSLDQVGQKATEGIIARCGALTLHGQDQQALFDWINETLSGRESRRTVKLTEELSSRAEGRSFTYRDAFPVRYVFPQFSASGTGNLYEEISIKPIRLELQ